MTSTCGGRSARARKASRCSTPNRCCSSTTTRPRSAKATVSCSRAWVPTTMPAEPSRRAASASRRRAAPIAPVSATTRVAASPAPTAASSAASKASSPARASGPSRACRLRSCWAASTSVGASSAHWPPESTTRSIARSATTVLPEPTSPCRSRCIGCGRASLLVEQGADLALAPGQREGQPGVEGGPQPVRASRPGDARRLLGRAPPLGQGDLHHDRLVPFEAAQPARHVRALLRPVHEPVGLEQAGQAVTLPQVRRQRVGQVGELVEHDPDAAGHGPARHLAGAGVDGHQRAGERPRRRRGRPAAPPRGWSAGSCHETSRPCRRSTPTSPAAANAPATAC